MKKPIVKMGKSYQFPILQALAPCHWVGCCVVAGLVPRTLSMVRYIVALIFNVVNLCVKVQIGMRLLVKNETVNELGKMVK